MTRYDYAMVSAAIREEVDFVRAAPKLVAREAQLFRIQQVALRLCETLALDNPRFNKHLFMQACGFTPS